MESKTASLLTVLSVAVTTTVIAYIQVGIGAAIWLLAVNSVSTVGWLLFSFQRTPVRQTILGPYLWVVVLWLVRAIALYDAEWPTLFWSHMASLPAGGSREVWWFLLGVAAPVCLLLLGGYFLSIGSPLGFFLGWWGFIGSMAASLLQFAAELIPASGYRSPYHLAALIAAAGLAAAITGLWRLIRPSLSASDTEWRQAGLDAREVNLWTLLLVSLTAVYGLSLYRQAGLLPVSVIVLSMAAGLVGWRCTTARRPADPRQLLPLYLLMLFFFYLHVGEEALTDFNQSIAQITGVPWSDRDFTRLIALIGPAVWVYGALSLRRGGPFGNFILWFMIVGMIVGEPTHYLLFPVAVMKQTGAPYTYFPGMYTALFPMIPAILALIAIVIATRHAAQSESPHARGY
jgi:hypothetical protein